MGVPSFLPEKLGDVSPARASRHRTAIALTQARVLLGHKSPPVWHARRVPSASTGNMLAVTSLFYALGAVFGAVEGAVGVVMGKVSGRRSPRAKGCAGVCG
jgi:hypothetical protein